MPLCLTRLRRPWERIGGLCLPLLQAGARKRFAYVVAEERYNIIQMRLIMRFYFPKIIQIKFLLYIKRSRMILWKSVVQRYWYPSSRCPLRGRARSRCCVEKWLSQQNATALMLLAWRKFSNRNDEFWRETLVWHGQSFAVGESVVANRAMLRHRGGSGKDWLAWIIGPIHIKTLHFVSGGPVVSPLWENASQLDSHPQLACSFLLSLAGGKHKAVSFLLKKILSPEIIPRGCVQRTHDRPLFVLLNFRCQGRLADPFCAVTSCNNCV